MKIYIDPGVRQHACAKFNSSGYLDSLYFSEKGCGVNAEDSVLIENPRITEQSRGKDLNDILDLAVAVGMLKGFCLSHGASVRLVAPAAWKGQVKKWIHHSRVWAALNPSERCEAAKAIGMTPDAIEAKIKGACQRWARGDVTKSGQVRGYAWAAHNLLDAVGLGLWDLRRMP